jgi:hypothetical protein
MLHRLQGYAQTVLMLINRKADAKTVLLWYINKKITYPNSHKAPAVASLSSFCNDNTNVIPCTYYLERGGGEGDGRGRGGEGDGGGRVRERGGERR